MVDDVFDEVGLKVENLHASYGAVEVLRGLNFEVAAKGVSVILGANGAGKTTTLRAICNMCTTSGSVVLGDEDITRTGTAEIVRKGVAHVPQGRGTFPELSTMDNLMIGAYTRKAMRFGTTLTVGLRSSHVYLNVVTSWLVRSQVVSNRCLPWLAH